EVRAAAARLAARARHGLSLPSAGRPAVSDLLLLAPGAPLPEGLEGAAAGARGHARVAPGERLGIYWEAYPPPSPGEVRWSLALRDERGGFWRGLGGALGLARRAGGEVGLEWSEAAPSGGTLPRAVDLALPAGLPEGDYALVLTARFAGHSAVTAERAVRVSPAGR
ncbi:MAG TPA: hypothetical protein VM778_05315, partial [Gemmatimonadota bacterium]|nr:hypothetical protein [Gemmatimonadota bacterium]